MPVRGRFRAGSGPVHALPSRRGAYFAARGRSRDDAVHFWRCAPGLLGAGGRSRLDAVLILHKNRALATVPAPGCKTGPCCCNPLSYGVSQSERRLLSCHKNTFSDEAMGVSSRHFLTMLTWKLASRAPVEAPCVFFSNAVLMTTSKYCSRCGPMHIFGRASLLIGAYFWCTLNCWFSSMVFCSLRVSNLSRFSFF